MSDQGTTGPAQPKELHTPPLRRRVTLTVLGLVAVMLLALALTTDVVLSNRLDAQLRQRLLDRAVVASALADQVSPQELVRRLEGDGVSVQFQTSDGQVYTAGPMEPPQANPKSSNGKPAGPKGGPGGRTGEVMQSGKTLEVSRELSGAGTITLLADSDDVSRALNQVRLAFLLAAGVVFALAAMAIGPIVARALRPLQQITGVARSISAGDRGQRLRPDRPDTELGLTAAAFDDMLDAVEGAEQDAVESADRLRAFLSDAAHELRTPLTGIQAAAEHMLRADPDRAEREHTLVALVREARRAGRLVEDMLLMARIDRGLDLQLSEVDLRELTQTVTEIRSLSYSDATLTVTGEPAVVRADADRIAQVIGNLVDNALDATRGTGTVTVAVSLSNEAAIIEVIDDGPGVAVADTQRIFERLVRLDTARTHQRGGVGLGLPIARGIARAHRGDLDIVRTSRAQGAQFRLSIPLVSSQSEADSTASLP